MSSSNMSNDSCFDYSDARYTAVVVVRSILAFVASLFILCMIGIIVFFQKYLFFTQRMIMYLAISSFTYSIVTVFNVSSLNARTSDAALNYCILMGFLEQVLVWWEVMAVTSIVIQLFIKTVFDKTTEKFEIVYILMIFLFPFLFSWIPFIHNAYGPAGLVCWIRIFNLDDCHVFHTGSAYALTLFYLPVFVIMIVLVILMSVSFIFIHRRRKIWVGTYNRDSKLEKAMEQEIRPLIYYPFIFIVINVINYVAYLYISYGNNDVARFVLGTISTFVYRLQGILITLVFTLDKQTRKKLNKAEIKAGFLRICSRKSSKNVCAYPAQKIERSDSKFYTSSYHKHNRDVDELEMEPTCNNNNN